MDFFQRKRTPASIVHHGISIVGGILFIALMLLQIPSFGREAKIYRIRQANSKLHLIQDWSGNQDSKRNVSVWQLGNSLEDKGFQWLFEQVDGQYWYIINMRNGLVLTQDGSGDNRNVSNWHRGPNSHRQQWRLEKDAEGYFMIINRATNQGLTQHDGGRTSGKRNVTTWPGQSFRDRGFSWTLEEARRADIAVLTIKRVTCIAPSTGQDGGTSALFAGLGAAVAAGITIGTAGAGAPVAWTALVGAMASGAGSGLGARSALESTFAGSDDLMIGANGYKIWPYGSNDYQIDSQDVVEVNCRYTFEKSTGVIFYLEDYDSGSSNDNLGSAALQGVKIPFEDEIVIANNKEKSFYKVLVSIEEF